MIGGSDQSGNSAPNSNSRPFKVDFVDKIIEFKLTIGDKDHFEEYVNNTNDESISLDVSYNRYDLEAVDTTKANTYTI